MDLEPSRVGGSEEIAREVRSMGRRVVTFGGFGELGYEDENRLLGICSGEIDRFDPRSTIVNTGTLITHGFREGIAAVYRIAKARGFTTVGVHPSVALDHPKAHFVAPGVDSVFFVRDPSWGGFREDGVTPSPTLRVLLEVTDEFVAIGGGLHTAQELRAFLSSSKPVRFHPARMNREVTLEWSGQSRVAFDDFEGAAHRVWAGDRRRA
jgi:hypothetical protein